MAITNNSNLQSAKTIDDVLDVVKTYINQKVFVI